MITPGTARFFSKGEGAPPQMRPVSFYIWSAQLASGVKGGDAEASPPGPQAPCEKNLGSPPSPVGKGVGGMGQKSYMGHGIAQTNYGQALEL